MNRTIFCLLAVLFTSAHASILRGIAQKAVGHGNTITSETMVQTRKVEGRSFQDDAAHANTSSILRGVAQKAVGHGNTITSESMVQTQVTKDKSFWDDITEMVNQRRTVALNAEQQVQDPAQQPSLMHRIGASLTDRFNASFLQLLFGIIYFFIIVKHYPSLDKLQPTPESIKLQDENEIYAITETTCANNCLACFCTGPRAAHTYHSAGMMDYWIGCCLASLFPCVMQFYMNSFTDLNIRLGKGARKEILRSAFCACCCTPCVVAQDAQSLDLVTGAKTEVFGVY